MPAINTPDEVETVCRAAGNLSVNRIENPFPWSEDFGRFISLAKGAMFGLGAGENTPELHRPEHDFPEALVPMSSAVFRNVLNEYLY
jgi:metal-dependent amidase/aminoacylase/carboxypeptidase family protein